MRLPPSWRLVGRARARLIGRARARVCAGPCVRVWAWRTPTCGVVAGFVGECGEVVVPWWAAMCAAPGRLWRMVPGLAEVSAVPVVRFRERACRRWGAQEKSHAIPTTVFQILKPER